MIPLTPIALPSVVAQMSEHQIWLLGSPSATRHRAVAAATLDPGSGFSCFIAPADRPTEVAGWVLAAVDWRRSLRRFLMRRPGLALGLGLERVRVRSRGIDGPAREEDPAPDTSFPLGLPGSSGAQWGDSAPTTGRILFIHVAPKLRGRGVGSALYRELFTQLAARGVRRINARVERRNHSSLLLHQSVGFLLEGDSRGPVFATREIGA